MTYHSRTKPKVMFIPKRTCRFCADKSLEIDYKNVKGLTKFINMYGKIESRKRTGNCVKHQRKIALAIKRARILALIPFISE